MAEPIRTIRVVVFCSLVLLLLPCSRAVSAGPSRGYPAATYGRKCTPNVREFGHYQTLWRRWPGDPRTAESFPRSINAEVLSTPKPQKQQPLPRTRLYSEEQEGLDTELPGILPGLPEGFPTEGGAPAEEPGFDFFPGATEVPAEPGGGSLMEPLLPGGLPTPTTPEIPAPFSPDTQELLPGLPVDPGGETPFEPPVEAPFSSTPDAGEALPEFAPPSVATAEVPDEEEMPHQEPALEEATHADTQPTDAPATGAPATGALATDVAANEPPQAEISEAVQPDSPEKIEAKTLQANWMAALHPGFRGETGRNAALYSTAESAVGVEPDELPAKQPDAAASHKEQPVAYVEDVKETAAVAVVLDGYCPVELLTGERWAAGDPRWTTTHKGLKYRFSGEAQLKRFLANPDQYTPVHSGHDPVLVVDQDRREVGKTDFCVTYKGRLYMFASARTLARFQESPQHYAVKP